MRKRLFGILIVLVFLFFTATCHASADKVWEGMVEKLRRGAVNILTGWIEFPAQIVKGYNKGFMGQEDNKLCGIIVGVVKGIGHTAGRTLSGAADVAGFWAANPKDNKNMVVPFDAEHAWEKGEPYDCYDPTFIDATMTRIVNKFLRGTGNFLFGLAELPMQMSKGISKKSPDLGITKGLWYWWSREVSGISDIATCLLPGPEDAPGVPFEDEWAWDSAPDVIVKPQ